MCVRVLSSNAALNKQVLQRLRSETGLPFIKIKEALQETNNDADKALKWLEKKAAEQNWAKAQKLSQRETSQGLVGVYQQEDFVGMVTLQCETESVAKNENFVSLLYHSAVALQQCHVDGFIEPNDALDLAVNGQKLSDIVTSTVGRLGENIQAKGFFAYRLNSPNMSTSSYLHRRINSDISGMSLGTIGSLAVFENLNNKAVGTAIAQHVVGTEDCANLLEQPLLQDESVTIGQLCEEHNFRIVDHYRMSAH